MIGMKWHERPENILTADTIRNSITKIRISDSIENLHVQYKGKEYKLNLEKALSILADAVEDEGETE